VTLRMQEPEPDRDPRFEALLQAARGQSAPAVGVTFADVEAAVARRSRGWMLGLAVAAGFVAVTVWGWTALSERTSEVSSTATPVIASDAAAESTSARAVPSSGRAATPREAPGGEAPGGEPVVEPPATEETSAVEPEPDAREEDSPDPSLTPAPSPTVDATPTAAELAAQAEKAMLAGRHGQAVKILRTLVRTHPRSAAAKAGLIDLARLEKRLGRPARAQCAYALFVRRFPGDSRVSGVKASLAALGRSQPRCRGLSPRSD